MRNAATRLNRRALLESGAVVWVLVIALFAFAFVQSDDFRTAANLSNISRQIVILGLVAAAQFIVVIAGGVDLSLAANARLSAIVTAIVVNGSDDRLLLGVIAGLSTGLIVGLVNGFIVTRLRVEPFIATLGTGALLTGLALFFASTPVGRSSPALNDFYGFSIGGVYAIVVLLVAIWIVISVAMNRSTWGRHLYAVGGDPGSAALAGINVGRVTASAYVWAGLLGGAAGVVILASAGVGDAASVQGLEFDSLAVVVIGGASLAGGRGRLIGVIGGVLLFSLIGNVFNLLKVDVWYQQLVRGLIILIAAAALVDRYDKRKRARRSQETKEVEKQEKLQRSVSHGNDVE